MIKHLIVSIDGPVASGKTTVGSRVAKKLKIKFLDSGRLYRVVALYTLNKDEKLEEHLKNIDFELRGERFFLGGEDITKKLDASEVGEQASVLSKQPILRNWVDKTIKKMALNNSIVVAGRDIGTVVLPSAHVKIFLTAN
ncbi:MAG: (d)CMP kinase, partial [Caldisericia bacterium]|nr:(d)CMP kinase [Caldisericia bacterium]